MFEGGEGGKGVGNVDGLEGGMEGGRGEGQEAVPGDVPAATEQELLEGVTAREGGKEGPVGEPGAVGDVDTEEGGGESGDGCSEIRVVDKGGREGEGVDVF